MRSALTVPLLSLVTLCPGSSPFGDVAQGALFCTDATWARNASITFGCGSGVDFCPDLSVTRAQMVLFLRRTAEATFPLSRFVESASLPAGDLDGAGLSSCATPPLAVASTANARYAHVHGVVSMRAGANAADVQMSVGHSIDGGAFTPDHTANQITSIPAGQWGNAAVMVSFVLLAPGTSNVWRIDLARAVGSATTGELSDLRCQLKVVSHMDFDPP
jgi:hypothetical protein